MVRLPLWAFDRSVGRLLSKSSATAQVNYEDDMDAPDAASSSSGAEDFEVLEKSRTAAQNGGDNVSKTHKAVKSR